MRFPHRQRYRFAAEEVVQSSPQALLDYGAGDCHLVGSLAEAGALPGSVVAYEPVDIWERAARQNLEAWGLLDRVAVCSDLESIERPFDCILCLGVLEHMPLPQRDLFYDTVDRLLAPGGRVVVDIPVESGPAILVKELGRRTLKGRAPEYSYSRLARRAVGLRDPDPARFDPNNADTWIQWHSGFDHRLLVEEIGRRYTIERVYGAPLKHVPQALNQECFVVFRR